MTTEDYLDYDEIQDEEVEELLFRVACLQQVKTHYQPKLASAEAYLRFYRAVTLVRELEEEVWQARGDFIIAGRRIRYFFSREGIRRWFKRPCRLVRKMYFSELKFAWVEFRNSCASYRQFASRALAANRAALSIIFLRQ